MGFQDNSADIFIDAVLTDLGREKLARNDGSFEIVSLRLADDEIDYRFWNELTGSDAKDRKILDTPVFEAFTNESTALRFPLITVRNARLQFLPKFTMLRLLMLTTRLKLITTYSTSSMSNQYLLLRTELLNTLSLQHQEELLLLVERK